MANRKSKQVARKTAGKKARPKTATKSAAKRGAPVKKKATKKSGSRPKRPRVDTSMFLLNCEPSRGIETDWSFGDAAMALAETLSIAGIPDLVAGADLTTIPPDELDLREDWWGVRNQGKTGACTGFAAADGVLRWQYVKAGLLAEDELPSPRFLWMANKETDHLTRYPTTFIEQAGTSTKLALGIAQKYGCVPEHMLPIEGGLSRLRANVFFTIAAQLRITAYYSLAVENLDYWRSWIANIGPVLTRLDTDKHWHNVDESGLLENYDSSGQKLGGHAVCLVGYTKNHFIVRNSWGTAWGDEGFAYASNAYCKAAFTEAYGAVV